MIKSHGIDIIKSFSQIPDTKRSEMKTLVKYKSVRMQHLAINAKCGPKLVADGHVDGAVSFKVLEKIKSENRCEGRLRLTSIDIKDAVQL